MLDKTCLERLRNFEQLDGRIRMINLNYAPPTHNVSALSVLSQVIPQSEGHLVKMVHVFTEGL